MPKQRPIVLHLYEDNLQLKLPEFLKESFDVVPVALHTPLFVHESIVGLIVDVSTTSDPIVYETILAYHSLIGAMGICLCTDTYLASLTQTISLVAQTVCFERELLRNESSTEWGKLETFLYSIAKSNHYNTALSRSSYRSSVLETLQIVAHQWRQPINLISMEAINMMVLASIDKTVKSPEVLKSSEFISQQVLRMSEILKSILNMGKEERIKQLFTVNELSDSVKRFFAEQFQNEEIELRVEILDENIKIYGFKTDLEEVIINLINNARDAYLENKIEGEKPIIFQAGVENESYLFCIKDKAGGVPSAIRDKIFEPKFSTKDKGVGFGIGLHFAQLTIEKEFGGSLTLHSSLNGSEFHIRLPKNDLSRLTFVH